AAAEAEPIPEPIPEPVPEPLDAAPDAESDAVPEPVPHVLGDAEPETPVPQHGDEQSIPERIFDGGRSTGAYEPVDESMELDDRVEVEEPDEKLEEATKVSSEHAAEVGEVSLSSI